MTCLTWLPARVSIDEGPTTCGLVIAGKLRKRGSWRKNWKERLFILRRDTHSLCYYRDEAAKLELLGEVAVDEGSRAWIETDPDVASGRVTGSFGCSL